MYRLYLDEVGTDDLTCLDVDNHRFLSLTGVAIDLAHIDDYLNPAIRDIKNNVFDCDPDEVIHLHRSDIVRRKKIFGQLNDNVKRNRFDQMLLELMRTAEYTVITVVIDKLDLTRRIHWENRHPYHYLLEIIVEKFVQFLERKNSKGDIMPEARRGKKDLALQSEFTRVWNDGTRYRGSDFIQQRLPGKQLKFRKKTDNISGLQLCDLIAHPSHMYVRQQQGHEVDLKNFSVQVRDILLQDKYDILRVLDHPTFGLTG